MEVKMLFKEKYEEMLLDSDLLGDLDTLSPS